VVDDVLEIGVLVQEQALWPPLHSDAHEVVERANVFHGELPLKRCDGFLRKSTTGSIRTISTYNSRYTVSEAWWKMKREVSNVT
jgi:hypothetical protein